MLCLPALAQTTPEEWFNKGVALMNQNNYDGATLAFDKAIELNPQYVEAWAGKGWSLYGSGRYNEALLAYDKANELNSNYPDAWAGKGFALHFLRWGDRISNELPFDKAIELDSNYGLAWFGILSSVTDIADPDSVNNLIKLNPSYAATILGSGEYYSTLSFKREVFLKGGRPRTLKATAPVAPPAPQKTVAERFAELNKNATK